MLVMNKAAIKRVIFFIFSDLLILKKLSSQLQDDPKAKILQAVVIFVKKIRTIYYLCSNVINHPKQKIMKKVLIFLFLSAVTVTLKSQTAEGIVDKYLESIGGIDKWKALKTAKLTGTVPTPQGDFTFEMFRKAPNKFIISLDVMGQKFVPQAYDGEVAWTLNPFMVNPAPQKLPEEQVISVKQEADFEDPFIDFALKGNEVVYEGTADVDGVNCFQLKLTKNKGKGAEEVVMNYFFDSETYLPIMVKQFPTSGQMAGQEMNVYYSDYQDAGNGLLMPYTIDTKVGGQSVQAVKFTQIELNGDIADDVFKFPGE